MIHTLRVITWNVRHFENECGAIDPLRAANAIKELRPDVIALQEVFHPMILDGHEIYPLRQFARELGMSFAFAKNIEFGPERRVAGSFGNAVLKRGQIIGAGNYPLQAATSPDAGRSHEPRGLLLVSFAFASNLARVFNTHLDPARGHDLQVAQAREVVEVVGISNQRRAPGIIVGDFNCVPPSEEQHPTLTRAIQVMMDAGYIDAGSFRGDKTYTSHAPDARIDYVFVQPGVVISRCEAVHNEYACTVSDHLPLFAELGF